MVCGEIFVLVVVLGVGLLLAMDALESNEKNERAVWKEELFIRASEESTVDDEEEGMVRESENPFEEREEITIAFAGDVSLADGYANMEMVRQYGGEIERCFDEKLLEEMHEADIFMINNEFTFSDRGTPLADKEYTFRAKTEHVKYLHDLGVDVVSLANNHAYDYGEISLLDTMTTLQEAEIPYVGAGRNLEEAMKPVYFAMGDRKIAFVAATQIEQFDFPDTVGAGARTPGVLRCWTEEHIYDVVRTAKENSDFVIAYMHWGAELEEELHWAQTKQAEELVEAGADLIIGAHPHCLQEINYVKGVPVVYSLGNFWFNSKTRDTGMVKVTLNKNGITQMQFIPLLQSGCRTTSAEGEDRERILSYMRILSSGVTIDAEGYIQKR